MSNIDLFLLLFVILVTMPESHEVNSQNWIIDQLLPEDYDQKQNAGDSNATIPLNCSIRVNSFSSNENQNSLKVEMDLCLKWKDTRILDLNISTNTNQSDMSASVTLTQMDRFWIPLVYFRNSLSSSVVNGLEDVQFVNVWPAEKEIHYCSKMTVTFICRYLLSDFPFDQQFCQFELENFEKSTQRLKIHLENITAPEGNAKFRVKNTIQGQCEEVVGDAYMNYDDNTTGHWDQFSCAYGGLRLVRRVNYYVIRFYLPTYLMMISSFVNFWLPTNSWPARVVLTATVLLSVITTSGTAYNEIPVTDVVTFYWWFWCVQTIVFFTLIEFALALAWVQFVVEKKLAHQTNLNSPDGYYFGKSGWYSKLGRAVEVFLHAVYGPLDFFDRPQERNKVDYVARILFPFLSVIFVIVYVWATMPKWSRIYAR